MKILVAEDDRSTRMALTRLLEGSGHEVIPVEDGAKAWTALCDEDAPRLALLDWVMPEMDGLEVCRRLRARQAPLPPYVIMITSKADTQDVVAGFDAGVDDYLVKPYDNRELMARIAIGQRLVVFQERLANETSMLRQREERFRAMLNTLPDVVMRFDSDCRHLFVSENVRDVVNIPAEAFLGKTHRDLGFPKEQCRVWEEAILRVFQEASFLETEFTLDSPKGERIYNWRLAPVMDDSGGVESALSVARDITEHRRAEEQYALLFNQMLDGFALHEIITDEGGAPVDYRFLAVNPAFERQTGLKARDIVGRTVLEALPDTELYWIETYGKVALTGENIHFEHYSQVLDQHFEIKAFRPAPGQFACIFTDISSRRRAERRAAHERDLLELCHRARNVDELAREMLAHLKAFTGCEAVGLRLRKDDDFPYYETMGFPVEFVMLERSLCPHSSESRPYDDMALECVCGAVIRGDNLPRAPFITKNGSFWFSNRSVLDTVPRESWVPVSVRGRCDRAGYQSFALVPLRSHQITYGLLQYADSRPGVFTPENVAHLEHLAGHITMAIEKLETEAALRASEARYRELVENANSVILRMDTQGRVTFFNEFAQQFFGYPESDILGKSVVGHIVPESDTAGRDLTVLIADICRNPDAYATNENENMRSNGERVWVHWTNKPVFDEKGGLREVLCIGHDITERRRAEAALHHKQLMLSRTESIAHVGSWEWEVATDTVTWSEELYAIFQRDPNTSPPSWANHEALYLPEDMERLRVVVNAALMEKTPYTVELRALRADGEIRHCVSHGQAETDKNGQVVRLFGFLSDITAQKRLEEQLLHSQKMESIGRLAGGIAHDFNNNLQSILGYAELALDMCDPVPGLRAHIEEIRLAGERSARLTWQLLAFARKQTISPQDIDLNEVVESMLKMMRRLIGEDITLFWKPAAKLWTVRMDPTQINQLLANLCVNARDAIQDVGAITIETSRVTLDDAYCQHNPECNPGDYTMLSVRDSGCGMDPHTMQRIFDPFFTTKEVGKGTGLGLATVYGIVKQNDGFVTVESETGQGTTFKVYFPRHDALEEDADNGEESRSELPGGTETVLVVEDDATVLRLATAKLQKLGYTVLAANSPPEAFNMARRHSGDIDLLITDVIMPAMNGRDVAEEIRKQFPQIQVLFMSGYTANVIAHHGILDEGVQFLQKPFSTAELAAKVREALLAPHT